MKLATLRDEKPDGRLVVVSRDLTRLTEAHDIVPTMQRAVETWADCAPALQARFDALQAGRAPSRPFAGADFAAPLPRAYGWCDGSAFLEHGRLMERAFKHEPRENFETIPLMYQGGSDDFLGPNDDVPLPDEAHGIDFEGELVVVTDRVPMACSADNALHHILLVGQANDWSLRNLIPREFKTGFGFFQSKPSTSFAPVLATPDELGPHWHGGRMHVDLHVTWNDRWFGQPSGAEMHFHFGQLIAHAARTRRLHAGTVIGSGTVSNERNDVGAACISEQRSREAIAYGAPRTAFMAFGDRVAMEARTPDGQVLFGRIDQRVVRA